MPVVDQQVAAGSGSSGGDSNSERLERIDRGGPMLAASDVSNAERQAQIGPLKGSMLSGANTPLTGTTPEMDRSINLQLMPGGPYLEAGIASDGGVVIGGGARRSETEKGGTDLLFGKLKIGGEHAGLEAQGGLLRSKDGDDHLNVGCGGWRAGQHKDGFGFEAYGTTYSEKQGDHQVDLNSYKAKFGKYKDDDGNDSYGVSLSTESGYTYKDKEGREFKIGFSGSGGPSLTPSEGFNVGGSLGVGASYGEKNKETGEYRKFGLSEGPSLGLRGYWGDGSPGFGFDYGPISYDRRSPRPASLADPYMLPVTNPRGLPGLLDSQPVRDLGEAESRPWQEEWWRRRTESLRERSSARP